MAIPTVTTYSGDKPTPGQNQSTFNQNMSDELDYLNSLPDELNPVIDEINNAVTTTSTAASAAQAASIAAAASANYQGVFIEGVTSASEGESYSYDGFIWRCAISTTDTPSESSANWQQYAQTNQLTFATIDDMTSITTITGRILNETELYEGMNFKLTDATRHGDFTVRLAADYTDEITADTLMGIYVPITGTDYVAVRSFVDADVRFFGETFDLGEAFQVFIDHFGTAGGVINARNKQLTVVTAALLPPDITGLLEFHLEGSTLTTGNYPSGQVFKFNKTADNQNFNNIHIYGGEVDCANCTDVIGHILVGSRNSTAVSASTWIGRFNADNIKVFGTRFINVPTDTTGVTTALRPVQIVPLHVGADEAVQSVVNDIDIRIYCEGGYGGVDVAAYNGGGSESTNCWFDNIHIEVEHYIETISATQWTCSHAIIGGYGSGGKLTGWVKGSHSGDNALEINGMMDVDIDYVDATDPTIYGLYVNNYKSLDDYTQQRIKINKLKGYISGTGRMFSFGRENETSNPIGQIEIGELTFELNAKLTSNGKAVLALPNGSGTKYIDKLTIDKLIVSGDVSGTLTANTFGSLLAFGVSGSSVVRIGEIYIDLKGVLVEGAYTAYTRIIEYINNDDLDIEIGKLFVKYDANDSQLWVELFDGTSNNVSALIKNKNVTADSVGTLRWTRIEDEPFSASKRLIYENPRLSSGQSISYTTSSAQFAYAKMVNPIFDYEFPLTTSGVSTSPYTKRSLVTFDAQYFLSGGTVSLVELSQDGVTFVTVATSSNVQFLVPNGSYLRITWSSIPTLRYRPL